MTLDQAIAAGRRTWAIVLRKQTIRLVAGETASPRELISWTYEGAPQWWRVRQLVYRRRADTPFRPTADRR